MQLDDLALRALGLAEPAEQPRRTIIAIAGSPGSGKTTLATALVARINELAAESRADTVAVAAPVARDALDIRDDAAPSIHRAPAIAVHLPMDGFHLANSTLETLGRAGRKGAIDTFDGWAYLALLRRLGSEFDHTVYAPGFDRTIDEAVAGQIAVGPDARLLITEGNYLLVDDAPWSLARPLFAETWFCVTPAAERLRRLIERHQQFGRTPDEARHWAETVDGANAALIEPTAARASLRIDA